MPRTKRQEPLYQRGGYRLYPRKGRNHEIIWYDTEAGRERGISAGTTDDAKATTELDRLYLENSGEKLCPHCHRPYDGGEGQYLAEAISDYLVLNTEKPSYHALRSRLDQVLDYLDATDQPLVTCLQIDDRWIAKYRKWGRQQEYRAGKIRSAATVEASVATLAAAITATQAQRANFKPLPLKSVNRTPIYRAGIPELAAMFRYCLYPERENATEKQIAAYRGQRDQLLRFLRGSISTWGRPDAVHDISTDPKRRQWFSNARVLSLNYEGRDQTKKFRATVPIAKQFATHLDETAGAYISVGSVRKAWDAMATEIGLPGEREGGLKLIRRSMATLARKRIGEANWQQGRMMLGHVKHDVSDIYALPDPANLGLALAATEAIIEEIDKACPGAFNRTFTAEPANVVPLKG